MRIVTILAAFLIGTASVFWLLYSEIPKSSPLSRDELTISDSKEIAERKIKENYQKQRLEDKKKFKIFWNGKFLKNYKENSLEDTFQNIDETYRFVWVPSFHSPILIRIWKSNNKRFLVAKIGLGEGFDAIKVSTEKSKNVTEEEWSKFIELFEQTSFWDITTTDEEPMIDGAFYSFEGNRNNKFHEVHMGVPSEGFRKLGAYLIKLAELKTEYENY